MNEIDAIESLIQPLLDAQTALVQHQVDEGDPQNGGQVKLVNDLIRSRDQAHDNLVSAIRATEKPKGHSAKPDSKAEHKPSDPEVSKADEKPASKPDEPDHKPADKAAEKPKEVVKEKGKTAKS